MDRGKIARLLGVLCLLLGGHPSAVLAAEREGQGGKPRQEVSGAEFRPGEKAREEEPSMKTIEEILANRRLLESLDLLQRLELFDERVDFSPHGFE